MSVPEAVDRQRGHDTAENWDEDFEFNGNPTTNNSATKSPPSSPRRSNPSTPSKDRRSSLNNWAEPGPSTPLRRIPQAENWDDDFQDADSPGPAKSSQAHTQNGGARGTARSSSPVENWDDEFEDGTTRTHASPKKRTPKKRPSWPSSDEEDEFGFADREDDRTVTTRSRGVPFHLPTEIPPPVPPLPSPFPRSPTASVFSVPVSSTTGRDSVAGYSYSSTAHLALRPTVSGSSAAIQARLALLPPSPPIHRERRRLRKKSRPPPNFEEGIFELDDRAELAEPVRPVTPENPKKTRDVPATSFDDAPPEVGNTSTTKTPLLSRIGSVGKKWGTGRKKRASTGPSEVRVPERDESSRERERHLESERSRPTSFIASSSPGHSGAKSWFFRGGGGGQGPGSPPGREGGLRHETSVERLLHLMGVERGREREAGSPRSAMSKLHAREGTDSSTRTLPTDLEEAVDGNGLPASALLFGGGTPKRPTSIQVSVSNGSSGSGSGSGWSTRPPVPRHVSYNDSRPRRPVTPGSRASSKQRSASASVEDVHRAKKSSTASRHTFDDHSSDAHCSAPSDKPPLEDQKGSRRFMGGIRRISLGGKHKRTKSITAEEKEKELRPKRPGTSSSAHETDASHDQSTPRPPSRVIRSSQDVPLLPPIELQPPSPPRNKTPRKPLMLDSANLATPTRSSMDRTLETSRSHPALSSKSSNQTTSTETALATIPSPLPSPTRPRGSTSPVQTASLGRTAQPPKEREGSTSSALRRNSLGDLKIPVRISQAQVSLKRDLTMVRDFATSVEHLKQLQLTYTTLVGQVRELINEPQESQSRPVSPSFIHFPKPSSRSRANTNPTTNNNTPTRHQLNTAFLSIEAKYRLSWECAELLIDLAGGGGNQSTSPPPSSQSAPVVPTTTIDGRKSRERAITLAGDEPKPMVGSSPGPMSPPLASPPPSQWRASTGRHDLSQRQLLLLREMLNNPDPSVTMSLEPNIPEEDINRNWRWGDAMNSTITLPSEESESIHGVLSPTKKQNSALRGMRHIREMLRRLKKNPGQPVIPQSTSSVSASTDSSLNLQRESRPQSVISRRRAKTSTGPESVASRHPNSPYGTTPGLSHKSSPRRPSLASIFRIGQKSKAANPSVDDLSSPATGLPSSSSGMASGTSLADDEEDWDRVESASDLDHAARALGFSADGTATVRGKKGRSPYFLQSRTSDAETARRPPEASLSSLFTPGESPKKPASAIPPSILENYTRSIKLSDVREHDTGDEGGPSQSHNSSGQSTRAPSRNKKRQSAPSPSPRRPQSRGRKNPTGSVRSAPPQPWGNPSPELSTGTLPLPDMKLAMAPENIKPLLENAREVHARCTDCIAELEALLGSGTAVSA